MELPKNNYHVFENFIDADYANMLADYFKANPQEDPREFYGFFPFGGIAEFFENPDFKLEFDPLNKINEMVHFSYNFFLKEYPIYGDFKLNRSHANLMSKGASLSSHRDDRDHEDTPIEDLGSKTHVAALFLNDDYEGGELYFEELDISLKPKAGTLVLFPGYYTRHGVKEITSGTRVNTLSHFFDITDASKINTRYTMNV
jgi:hypothetical protein